MSKIGKKPVQVPSGVDVKIDGSWVSAKGQKGEIKKKFPVGIEIKIENSHLVLKPKLINKESKALWGLAGSMARNMMIGVSEGFVKVLEFQGVGYKAIVKDNNLELGLGFSHPIFYSAPEGITFKTEKNTIIVQGIDKELIGKVAAEIRSFRKPEPYKGSGIRYKGEIIIRKAGKKAVASG
ncbi:MAG: 50S ribosomal protein L6 [Candidatus Yanofskybacteria bacterium CG10_big_fil_rev_8_21_14_0_10_37_15]|uniref:Large ribosomal subunit protein uL6 n=1 Tax=Candidatus Yanofskybacteria bacterium CG10_big_fil_rev_8_21_14_0_10_37_15 TaxID=1975097 RepID=A0A2H0R5X1_9BACT|nr:MAG: 50S ribosomal protein L6 [Candidatus Yanofskybacteria bacterium CG10_big_fil_rev_8_21_14_0_10_37_15]